MLSFVKEKRLTERKIPFGVVEVRYPETLRVEEFRQLVDSELASLRVKYADYDRKTVFSDNPYFRFFKKFKKTYPVMMQFESVLLKGKPFPAYNPVAEVPFFFEIMTHVLSGAHDADRINGAVEIYLATQKEEFPGLRGTPFHTYPGDVCGRDQEGIIFSTIAGADARTCARTDSRHVMYPVFGTPELPERVLWDAMEILIGYIKVLSPDARIETAVF